MGSTALSLSASDECSNIAPFRTIDGLALCGFFIMWLLIVWEAAPVPSFNMHTQRLQVHVLRLERPLAALVRCHARV